jgi:hypothetical protein
MPYVGVPWAEQKEEACVSFRRLPSESSFSRTGVSTSLFIKLWSPLVETLTTRPNK